MGLWDLVRQGYSGNYAVRGDPATADCVIGFSFGALRGPDRQPLPGPSNEMLAQIVRERFLRLPLILQWEIADACSPLPDGVELHTIRHHRKNRRYLDTGEVVGQAAEIMQTKGWKTAVVLAHAHHAPRAAATCHANRIRTVLSPGLHEIPFCPRSLQWWTCNRFLWRLREVPAIVSFWCLGQLADPEPAC